jgi:hypothetical protein
MNKLNLNDLQSDKPEIKYHCAKQAILQSENNPATLYGQLDTFIKLLDGENNVLRWTALIVIGNLSAADRNHKINRLVPRLTKFTQDPSLITASNAAKALGKIAQSKPAQKNKILLSLLAVEKVKYYNKGKVSPECRNIVIGHVLDVLADFSGEFKNNKPIMAFIKRHAHNSRHAVQIRAQKLLRKVGD